MGVSLTEQATAPARELDELLHVHRVYLDDEARRNEDANRT
jgi:hypothetical protein